MSHTVDERRFRAMESDAHVIVVGDPDDHDHDRDHDQDREHAAPAGPLADRAVARITELEARWSRFLPDSEISELNRRAGETVAVSADTVLLVTRAIEAWRLTGGGFDPMVLGAVLTAGYDRSFEELVDHSTAPGQSTLLVGCTDIVVSAGAVRLPDDTGFDPGGIGKGLAADLVVHELLAAGAAGVCVNLGGDLRVAGTGPDGGSWTVAIEHPWSESPVALVGLADGAVATSTTLRRTWLAGGTVRHHFIDPATGEPSDTDLNLVSIVTGQAWVAEVLARAVLLRGTARAFDLLDPAIANALTVARDGTVYATPGLAAHLGGVPLPSRLAVPADDPTAPASASDHPIPYEENPS